MWRLRHHKRWHIPFLLIAGMACLSTTSMHPSPMTAGIHQGLGSKQSPTLSANRQTIHLRGGQGAGGGGEGERGHSLRFFCGTWNVNGKPPSVPLEEWLLPRTDGEDVDVYVLGLQEVQDLSGTQALITDEEKGRTWSMNIQRTLGAPHRFQFVAARQMVGIYLCVLVRSELVPHLSELRITELGTGFLQQGGNKGGVAARFTLFGARVCVVSSHLAAQVSNTEKRNKDFRELVHRVDFNLPDEKPPVKPEDLFVMPDPAPSDAAADAGGDASTRAPQIKKTRSGVFGSGVHLTQLASLWESATKDGSKGKADKQQRAANASLGILEHDVVLWVGDLNYRFNLPEQAVVGLIAERNWELLREFDQLNIVMKAKDAFQHFVEPTLSFVPTYKLERWGTAFAAKDEGRGLKRVPAWCDRVLYRRRGAVEVSCEAYRRHEVLGSDHRPVSALLRVALPPPAALAAGREAAVAEEEEELEEGAAQSDAEAPSSAPVESDGEGWAVMPEARGGGKGHAAAPVVANLTAEVDLYESRTEILLVPTASATTAATATGQGAGDGKWALVVDKRTQGARWVEAEEEAVRSKVQKAEKKGRVHGVLGVAKLSYASYLVVVRKTNAIGVLGQGSVHAVVETEVLPVSVGPPVPESEEEKRAVDDREYGILKDLLLGWKLFFSREFDVTHTQQRLHQTEEQRAESGCGGLGGAFVWNARMLDRLGPPPGASRVLIPAVCGFFKELEAELRGETLRLALISRRSRHRAGVRFFARGVDEEGHVANQVETEQVLTSGGGTSSFVVLRGSIPLYWQEGEALVTLKPQPTLVEGKPHAEAMQRHLAALQGLYGRVAMLSLIDTSGVEGPISQAFKQTAAEVAEAGVSFTEFDFHKNCGKTASPAAASGVAKLLESLSGHLGPANMFKRLREAVADGGEGAGEQETVFRVNCIDCLDRTNVLQAALASRMLGEQLRAHGLLEEIEYEASMFAARGGYAPPLPLMSRVLRGMWADMGDAVSVQYAGTGALKGDFTRSGKRTIQGIFSDGIANVKRAMQNNFADGYRQQVIDLIHGVAVGPTEAPGLDQAPAPGEGEEEEWEGEGGEVDGEAEEVEWSDRGDGWDAREGVAWEGSDEDGAERPMDM